MAVTFPVRAFLFCSILITSTALLFAAWAAAPEHLGNVPKPRKFPSSLEELQGVAMFLGSYRDDHFAYTISLFSFAYLFKQTFAIPGSFFMNILAGALFGRMFGSLIVCPLAALGASMCYLLSAAFARPIVERFFKKRVRNLRDTVHENEHRLFYFLLCARFFPFTPHWLLNICSPFIDIDIRQFALSVLIGLAPYNILCVHAGGTLAQLRTFSDVISVSVLLELIVVASLMGGMGAYAKKRNAKQPSMM